MKVSLAALLGIIAMTAHADELQTKLAEAPGHRVSILYYNDSLLIANHLHAGKDIPAEDHIRQFLIHSKRHDRWLQIHRVTTQAAIFGKKEATSVEEQQRLHFIPVDWDDTRFKELEYVPIPIREPSFFALPEAVEYEEHANRFVLRFHTSSGVKSVETRLYISEAAIEEAFQAME